MPETGWVLAGTYGSGPHKDKPQFHLCATPLGPASTPNLSQAEVFPTKEAAAASVGFTHWASFLHPKTLEDARAFVEEFN